MNYTNLKKTTTGHAARTVAESKKPFTIKGIKARAKNIAKMAAEVSKVANTPTNQKWLNMLYWDTVQAYCLLTIERHGKQLNAADYNALKELEQEAFHNSMDTFAELSEPIKEPVTAQEKMDVLIDYYYNDLLSLAQRLSLDGNGKTYDEDYIALTRVLEAIEAAKEQRQAAAKETSREARKIAAYIYATAVLNQNENNWTIYGNEIESNFEELPENWQHDEKLVEEIEIELYQYPGLENNEIYIEYDGEEIYFDVCLWTDYIASDYDA